MTRLPPRPDIEWREDGTPVALNHGDVYFSAHNGLEETRAVFLRGCNVPEAWQGKDVYTVAELGFGTGLNFLALCELWEKTRPTPNAQLHFISFEGFPLDAADADKALRRWPELDEFRHRLIENWPVRMRGVQRIVWPDAGITLTLHIDEISKALPASSFKADAWFLDGFSPAKNSDMWSEAVYPLIAERSALGAVIGTYTVAGHVRRGLAAAGFEVSKQPGFARKRERLEAIYSSQRLPLSDIHGLRGPAEKPKQVAVIGGGIAGCTIANKLARRGLEVVLYDEADALGAGASGNPIALVKPRLDVGDTVTSRLLLESYVFAHAYYRGLPGVTLLDVDQPAKSQTEMERYSKLIADPPLEPYLFEASEDGIRHRNALALRPAEVLPALLSSVSCVCCGTVSIDLKLRTVNGQAYDAIILATGSSIASTCKETAWLDIRKKAGQIEYVIDAPEISPLAVSSGKYVIALSSTRLVGANFEACDKAPDASPAVRGDNLEAVEKLAPDLCPDFENPALKSRVSIRATTADSLPIVGALPDYALSISKFSDLRDGKRVAADAPLMDGVFLLTGLGARGFTFAPLMAEYLASQMFGEAPPLSQSAMQAISPMRQILRGLKRGKL